MSCISACIYTNALEAQKELKTLKTPNEVKAFTRSSNKKFDRSMLKGYRVTIGHRVNFREEPSMKSTVITTLPIATLVEIIDKSNRSWLLVEIEIDGSFEQGWIFAVLTGAVRRSSKR